MSSGDRALTGDTVTDGGVEVGVAAIGAIGRWVDLGEGVSSVAR